MRYVPTRLQCRLHDSRPISDEWVETAVVIAISCFACLCIWMALTHIAIIRASLYKKYTDTGEISYDPAGRDEEGVPRMVFLDVTDDPRAQEACRTEPPPFSLLFSRRVLTEHVTPCYVVGR